MEDENNYDEEFEELVHISIISEYIDKYGPSHIQKSSIHAITKAFLLCRNWQFFYGLQDMKPQIEMPKNDFSIQAKLFQGKYFIKRS